ncbi:MAG: glycosyltransferase family 39 protein [Candidatus Pacearchaeota archaeon]|nr:glycosyltransferase family 39 protein [Candidatus Pacearchaeota archaeon]
MEEIKGEIKEPVSDKELEKRKNKIKNFFFGWIKDNYDKVFFAILIGAFILRFWIFLKTMNQPLWWDEADYLSAGKRMGLGLDIRDIWYYRRGFLFPIVSALFFFTGLGETGIRFLMVLFSTGIVAVSYFLISKMFNKKVALLTSLALTLSWIFLFFTGRILTDIPAAFFLLLSLFFFWKGYVLKEGNKFLYLFGLVFALAVLTRMQSLMLAPPFLFYVFMTEKLKVFKNKKLWITLGIFLILLVPHFILYSMHYGNPLGDITSHYLGIGEKAIEFEDQRTFSTATFNYFKSIPYMISIPLFVMLLIGAIYFFGDLIIGFDKITKDETLKNKLFVLMWVLSLFLIMGYIGSVSYVEERYVSSGLPFLFLIAISPLMLLEKIIIKNFNLKKILAALVIFVVLFSLLIPNFLWANSLLEKQSRSYSLIQYTGNLLKENSNPEDIIISTSLPQITYYSERSTYPYDVHYDGLHKGDKELLKYADSEEGFKEFLLEKKPRFLMVSSIFESYPEWMLTKGETGGMNYVYMPFFNSSMLYNPDTGQIISLDLKEEVKNKDYTLKLFFPQEPEEINGVFIYEVIYPDFEKQTSL